VSTFRFTAEIGEDHTIVLPEEIPQGTVEVLVLVKQESRNGFRMPLRGTPYHFEDPFSSAVDAADWTACQ
jgi:hypothetical protein